MIPSFLTSPNLLIPVKIDITYRGARLVDTFCWDLYNPVILPEEFAARTCADMNLPAGFHERITLQLVEQIDSYKRIIDCVHQYHRFIPNWEKKVREIQPITIGIRQGSLDYSDKIDWDPMGIDYTPEEFAITTCADLGLPAELEPAIAHKIREALFRWLINILQNPNLEDTKMTSEFPTVDDTKTVLMSGVHFVDMVSNLWKRAKPNTIDECAAVPQPQLPVDRDSNASIWTPSTSTVGIAAAAGSGAVGGTSSTSHK
jgi:hypothetical protein